MPEGDEPYRGPKNDHPDQSGEQNTTKRRADQLNGLAQTPATDRVLARKAIEVRGRERKQGASAENLGNVDRHSAQCY